MEIIREGFALDVLIRFVQFLIMYVTYRQIEMSFGISHTVVKSFRWNNIQIILYHGNACSHTACQITLYLKEMNIESMSH